MTIPYYIDDPTTFNRVEVPQEIIFYCDSFTLDAYRDDLRYHDCVSMQMGYYGNSKHDLKKNRDKFFDSIPIRSIFE